MGMLNGSMRAVLCVRVPGIFIPSHCGTQAGRGLGRGWRNNLVSKLNRHVREQAMKHLLIATIAAVLVVGCGEAQQSAPAPEAQPAEPVAEASQPKPPTVKAPDISIYNAVDRGNIEAVKQHIAAGTDVNARDDRTGWTPLHLATIYDHKEIAELLIANGAEVNAKNDGGFTPLHAAALNGHKGIAELLIEKGANVNAKDGIGGKTTARMGEIKDQYLV